MAKAPETPASEPAFDLRKLMGEFDPNKLMMYRPRFFAHKAASVARMERSAIRELWVANPPHRTKTVPLGDDDTAGH